MARAAVPLIVLAIAVQPLSRWMGWSADGFGDAATVAFLALVMASFGHAYAAGTHVRIDILSRRFPARWSAAVELAGTLLVLMPLCFVVVADGATSTWRSLLLGERWADTAWPLQWLVRIWIPIGFLLLALAALASALRAVSALRR